MRRSTFGASLLVSTVLISSSASAQTAHRWAGAYVGANLGYTWAHSDVTTSTGCGEPGSPGVYLCNTADVSPATTFNATGAGSLSDKGISGGGHAGYNLQSGAFVYGAEVDLSSFNFNVARTASGTYTSGGGGGAGLFGDTFTHTTSMSADWLFTARGRLGWTFSSLLVYATGGLAVTDMKISNSYNDTHTHGGPLGGNGASSNSELRYGWTLGGGAEWALSRNWTLRGEYLYVNFGSTKTGATITNPPHPGETSPLMTSGDLSASIARLGVSYRF